MNGFAILGFAALLVLAAISAVTIIEIAAR
jgi:hypothetical protein